MNDRTQELARLALLLALATVIHTMEAFLPVTVGWFRFGFANIIGLATLYMFGFKDALIVTFGRIFLGSLVSGLFGSPAFLLSLSGGSAAICAMGLAHRYAGRAFSEIGISIIGAVFHNTGQLVAAYVIIVRHEAILTLFPLLLLTASVTGLLNGLATRFFVERFTSVTQATG
jgi:heptaprenyl diphosphate synthase